MHQMGGPERVLISMVQRLILNIFHSRVLDAIISDIF